MGHFFPFFAGFLLVISSFAESRCQNLTIFLDKETYNTLERYSNVNLKALTQGTYKQDNNLKFLKSYHTILPIYFAVLTLEQ